MKRSTFHLFTLLLAMVLHSVVQDDARAQQLSPEGQLRKSTRDFLFSEFANDRKCNYSDDKKILQIDKYARLTITSVQFELETSE